MIRLEINKYKIRLSLFDKGRLERGVVATPCDNNKSDNYINISNNWKRVNISQ